MTKIACPTGIMEHCRVMNLFMLFLPTPNRIEEVYEERVTSFTFNARLFPVEAMACSGAEKLLALKNAELFPHLRKGGFSINL